MISIDNIYLANFLNEKFGKEIKEIVSPYGMLTIIVEKNAVYPISMALKNDPEIQMNFLTDLCGVHYPDSIGQELGVVYHLHSFVNNIRIRIKSFTSITNPTFQSLVNLFDSANWMERETFDFYGIEFEGHPNLKRILNVDDMDYFPLRKEYKLEDGTRTDKVDSFFGR